MSLSEYVDAIKRGWVIILITFLVSLACASALQLRKSPVYSSTTQLFVGSAVGDQEPEELYQRNQIANGRVASYVGVIGGDVVADRVKEELGDPDIEPSVIVTSVPNTVLLTVTATASNPEEAADVASAYAEVVPSVIEGIENVDGATDQVRVTTTDRADVPSAPVPQPALPAFVAAGILGLGIGFTIVVGREVLRREREAAAGASDRQAIDT